MKKKLLAIIVAVTMLVALFVPMSAVSAENKTIVFELGEITYSASLGEINVPLNIVENNSDIYAAQIYLESEQGLTCTYIKKGTIKDSYEDPREGTVEFGLNYTINESANLALVDSQYDGGGLTSTGLVATFSYKLPEGKGEADIDEFTFKFGDATMLVAFDDSHPEAVLKTEEVPACEHKTTEENIVTEPQVGVAGLKEIKCADCGEVLRTEEIPALEDDTPEVPPVNPDAKTIIFELGEITYSASLGEINVPLNIVENNSDIYAAQIYLESEQGLTCTYIKKGTIKDSYEDPREGTVEFGLNYTINESANLALVDSQYDGGGLTSTGLVATFSYKLPEGKGEADIDEFTFKFGDATMLVAFDDSHPVAVLRDKPAEPCTHEATKEVVVKEATCTEAGSKNVVCVKCSEVLDTITIDALGHGETEEVVTKEATCTETGSKDIKCTVCGEVLETKAIDALGHTFEPDPENDVAPTCTEAGKKAYKCACGETKFEEVPATGHTFEVDAEASVDATCTEDGKLVEKCACGEVKETVVPAKGHTFVEDETKRVNPTLEAEGKQVFVCECGETKEVVVAKLEGKVEDKEAGFEVKVEEGKGLPTDIAPVEKEAPAKDKLPEGLKAVTSIIFDTDFTDLVKDVVAEIVIDLAKYIDVKDYNTVSIGVLKDGKVEVIEAKFDGSKVTFNGKVDGEIVLLVEDKAEVEEVKPEATKPGDDFSAVLYIAFALVAAAGVVVIGKKRISL